MKKIIHHVLSNSKPFTKLFAIEGLLILLLIQCAYKPESNENQQPKEKSSYWPQVPISGSDD